MPEVETAAGSQPRDGISAVVNTRNEAERLPGLLATLLDLDEILIADMESTDSTIAIAEAAGARIIELPNAGFCEPGRMPAISSATFEWVLVLDADERLAAGAIPAIRRLLTETPPSVAAYRLPRTNHLGKQPIRGSGWGLPAELHARLFRRETVDWPPIIHSQPTFDGVILDLRSDGPIRIEHDNFEDVEHLLAKLNVYTTIEASQLLESGARASLPMALRFGLEEIVNRYDPDADGSMSLVLSLAMFAYRFNIAAKVLEASGWPNDQLIARRSLVAAVNAMWSELRHRELQRTIAEADDGTVATLDALRATNQVWATTAPTLTDHEVDTTGDPSGPWRQLVADESARTSQLVEQVVAARVEAHEHRHALAESKAELDHARREAKEAERVLAALTEVAEEATARLREAEFQLAAQEEQLASRLTEVATTQRSVSLRSLAGDALVLARRARHRG